MRNQKGLRFPRKIQDDRIAYLSHLSKCHADLKNNITDPKLGQHKRFHFYLQHRQHTIQLDKCSLNCLLGASLHSEVFPRLICFNPHKPVRYCLRVLRESESEMWWCVCAGSV